MSTNYDNWERLVSAVLQVERDKQIAMIHSEESSGFISSSSSFTSTNLLDHHHESPIDHQRNNELIIAMDYSDLPPMDYRMWRMMLPSDKKEVVLRSASVRFFVDQMNGNNCFLFGATNVVKPSPTWVMKAHPKSSFSEVGELGRDITGFIIQGIIRTQMLTPKTLHATYLVFELTNKHWGPIPVHTNVKLFYDGSNPKGRSKILDLDQPENYGGNRRRDKWMEIELGDFYVGDESLNGRVEVQLWSGYSSNGLIVEGIEFRPLLKNGKRLLSKLWISGCLPI